MFSGRRIGKIFLALLMMAPFYVGCSKAKTDLPDGEGSEFTQTCSAQDEDCEQFNFSEGGGDDQLTDSLKNYNNSDFKNNPPQGQVQTQQQGQCFNSLGQTFGAGLGNTQNFQQDFNMNSWFGGQQGGSQQQTQSQSQMASCLGSNMSQQTAANMGVASYTQQNNCTQKAYAALNTLTGVSFLSGSMAANYAIAIYADCALGLSNSQSRAVQWGQNSQLSFGYVQYYLAQFIQMLLNNAWY